MTAGAGRTAEWGGRVQEFKAGDIIWRPPGVKHWHGASPTTSMTHLALTGTVNNRNVEWMEKVTDSQYNAEARTMNTTHTLSAKQRSIIPIAAFVATGNQERLKTALTWRAKFLPHDHQTSPQGRPFIMHCRDYYEPR